MDRAYWITGILAVGIGVSAVDIAAADQGRQERGAPRISFEQLDANGDGKITQDEMKARKAARFAVADANGDGVLSVDEITARASQRMAKRVDRMMEKRDANGDGVLSLSEMDSGKGENRLFKRLDTDNDGAISAAEYAAVQDMQRKRHRGNPVSE